MHVSPNPANNTLFIKTESKAKRAFYNSVGQLLFLTDQNEIDISGYSKGIYYIRAGTVVKKVVIE